MVGFNLRHVSIARCHRAAETYKAIDNRRWPIWPTWSQTCRVEALFDEEAHLGVASGSFDVTGMGTESS